MAEKLDVKSLLDEFVRQANGEGLQTSTFPKEYRGFRVKVSFGKGSRARVPWIAFLGDRMTVMEGFFPSYLYYVSDKLLILAFGVSEGKA